MKISELVDHFSGLKNEQLGFEELGKVVRSINWSELEYKEELPRIENPSNYARNILLLDPLELVLLRWPAGVESAVHWHEGFYGYVVCLEGACDNVTYYLKDDTLNEDLVLRGLEDGIIEEEDGVIHKLCNPDQDREAVTLHIYYPSLESFQGMKIFDIENQKVGVLNDDAKTSSWEEPEIHFEQITENAFTYQSHFERKHSTHRMFPVVPKPDPPTITNMLADYYNEQAREYDFFDTQHKTRHNYNLRINKMISAYLDRLDVEHYLDLACGTGRRATEIRELSGKEYQITGVDLSSEMCEMASKRGINAECKSWRSFEYPSEKFDVVTFLYAFGHICSSKNRRDALKKIYHTLKPGGYFFFDVFNLNDKTEWGPNALKAYKDLNLNHSGYEKGDVFYKKEDGKALAFLHYFTEDEIMELLSAAGFEIESIQHIGYVHRPGEVLDENEGSLFVIARKPLQ